MTEQPLLNRARLAIPLIAALAALEVGAAGAEEPTGEQQGHRGPPPEAIAACQSLASAAQCNFTDDHGAHSGTCWAPAGKPLACKPAGKAPAEAAGPPQN